MIELAAIDFANEDTDADLSIYLRSLMVCVRLTQIVIMQHRGGIVAAQAVERGDFDLAVSQLTFAESRLELPELRAWSRSSGSTGA